MKKTSCSETSPRGNPLRAGRFALTAMIFAAVAIPCISEAATTPPDRAGPPNVIVIMADDLGYGDLGCYGGKARTPHLDRLAREGLRFTDFHSNGAVCSPTRAAFLTGRYQQRAGIVTALGENAKGLPPGSNSIASFLKPRGYATGLFGKWHLGYHPENSPLQHGFEEFRGHLHGALDYFSKVDQYGRVDWWHNDQPVSDNSRYATDVTAQDTIDFVTAHRARPFFAFVAFSAIHFPWQSPEDGVHRQPGNRYPDVTGPQNKLGPHAGDLSATVIAMIESLDQGVGRIVDRLKSLGLDRRTLVFFTSDNGGILTYRGGYVNISSNGPLRGAKGSLHEGGHRVPAIAWWPGRIEAGGISGATAASMDLLPTLLELAGIDPRAGGTARALDGVSITPVLFANRALAERDLFWRLTDAGAKAARRGPWKLILQPGGAPELYNLVSDPAESRNLAGAEPQRVAALQAALARWEKSLGSPHTRQ
jgi:arylsulfatase A-like enzyme